MALVVEGLTKRFGATAALNGVSLQVPRGGFIALLGPSGSGKTTLLRILGGLDHAESGRVTYDGNDWLNVPTRERRAGFVFQQYALFRHMTVADNIAFGLRVRPRSKRPSRAEISRRVEELLALVQLEGLAGRYPAQLSGGQRQRVRLRARSPSNRNCFCSTSPSARSTRRCARICAAGCAACTSGWN